MSLGERLKKLREEKGLAQNFVAKKLGIANTTLSGYENNDRKPDPDMLKKLADFFNVSTDYLLGRSPIRQLSIDDPNIKSIELREGVNTDEITPERLEEIKKALSNLQSDLDKLKKSLSKR